MNVRIFLVRAMERKCAQTRHRFILSSERVLEEGGGGGGGSRVRTLVNFKGKIPSIRKKYPQRMIEPTAVHQAGQQAQHITNELFRPQLKFKLACQDNNDTIRSKSRSPHCAVNCLQHVCSSGQHAVVCKSRETHRGAYHAQHAVYHMVGRNSSAIKFDRVEIELILC